jgi:hypothetical protein
MWTQQVLALVGTGLGTIGSILTAFGLNGAIRELKFARSTLQSTVESLARNDPNIVIATGHDKRINRAFRCGSSVVWLGIALLLIGLGIQVLAVVTAANDSRAMTQIQPEAGSQLKQ